MSESFKEQIGQETERYSDEFLDEIISEVNGPTPKAECGEVRRWYNNKVLSVVGVIGLGLLAGAAGACKEKKKTSDLVTYSIGCYGAKNGKKFLKHRAALEKDCVEHRTAWLDQRQTPELIDIQAQQRGLKACKRYEEFLLANQSKADKIQRNPKVSFEKRGVCRKLWNKIRRMVGKNETENIIQLESNY